LDDSFSKWIMNEVSKILIMIRSIAMGLILINVGYSDFSLLSRISLAFIKLSGTSFFDNVFEMLV
jgi:hypothetical protein